MSVNRKQVTSDKIMTAAIDLMAERGYNGVTTEDIATKAGFTEKTLFRHFQSKQNLLESAFHRYHYAEEMKDIFAEKVIWDLQADLHMISQNYHRIMYQNRKMIQISTKEAKNLPGFQEDTHKHPEQLKAFLTEYFEEMYKKGKIVQVDPEGKAVAFLYMNFGAAMGRMNNDPILNAFSIEAFIEESVSIFTRALTP
ncbi:TetR/AcrR family transcriptional regulator [Salibacterium halotolerans]|uniref:DNA-binding transcriptional regulator, AcrR family n=1 Tax=Salibacterium halotolerans TaxID=1884432 RepID=A0A1I5YAQ3_9BACI|nr:TetR/AcrR family transcriptional regulator [Salibacterium halotolerans]SFQ41301.1 DNA-binding transcriptional regulator, AcrR family [Salibacterium halotolerans]